MVTFNRAEAREIVSEANRHPKVKKYNISIVPSGIKIETPVVEPIQKIQKDIGSWRHTLNERQEDFHKLRLEQAKLSNTIFDEVQRGASISELAELYEKIESFRPELITLYKQGRRPDQSVALPEEKKEIAPPADLFSLKDQKRKLISQRNKKSTLVKQWTAAGHKKLMDWQLELDKLNAEYILVNDQINKMIGK